MRALGFIMVLALVGGCRPTDDVKLPEAGSLFEETATGDRFKVTWAGKTSYNLGGCPEVGSLCVHLVRNVNDPTATELAFTLSELNSKFRPLRR